MLSVESGASTFCCDNIQVVLLIVYLFRDSFWQLEMKERLVSELLGISFEDIREDEKPVSEISTIDPEVDYTELLSDLQYDLSKKASVYGSPYVHPRSERVRMIFVETFLCDTISFAKKNNNLLKFTSGIQLVPESPIDELETTGKCIADYAIIFDGEDTCVGNLRSRRSSRKNGVVIEVVEGMATEGL